MWLRSWSIGGMLVGAGAVATVLLTKTGGTAPAEEQTAEQSRPILVASAPPAQASGKPASGFFFSPALPPAGEATGGGAAPPSKPAAPAPRAAVRPAAFFYGGVPAAYGASYPAGDSNAYSNGGADAYASQQYSAAPATAAQLPLNLFSIVGVPNNGGEILWPLAFRLLPDTQRTNALLLQTNSQFLAAMGQRYAQARPDPAVTRALRQSLAQLRVILVQNDATLGHGIYSEARDFLNRLDQAATLVAQSP